MARASFRGISGANVAGCFFEPNTTGEKFDIDAPRNAPLKDPGAHLDRLVWHSALYQYEILAGPIDVTVNHTALAAQSVFIGVKWNTGSVVSPTPSGLGITIYGNQRDTDILLYSHGLGERPQVRLALNGRMLPSSYLVQQGADNSRSVSCFVTDSGVYLHEHASSGASALDAITVTYQLLVLRTRAPDPAKPLFARQGGTTTLARGVIDTSRRYLRRVGAGETAFSAQSGPHGRYRRGPRPDGHGRNSADRTGLYRVHGRPALRSAGGLDDRLSRWRQCAGGRRRPPGLGV